MMIIKRAGIAVVTLGAALSVASCSSATVEGLQDDASSVWESATGLVTSDDTQTTDVAALKGGDVMEEEVDTASFEEESIDTVSLEDECGWQGQLRDKAFELLAGVTTRMVAGAAGNALSSVDPYTGLMVMNSATGMPSPDWTAEEMECERLEQLALLCSAGNANCNRTLTAMAQSNLKAFRKVCTLSEFAQAEACQASDQEILARPLQ